MPFESCAASRPQQGHTQNEDAFLVQRGEHPFAALCDGAGNAQLAARRALTLFQKLIGEASQAQLIDEDVWMHWAYTLDSSLLGGNQSTLLAVTMVGQMAVGVCVGDSRLYLLNREGQVQIVTEGAAKQRLGSGEIRPFAIRLALHPHEMLLLMSDGAWTPLSLCLLQRTAVSAAVRHFTEVPGALLDVAGRAGRADDMTVLALRLLP